MKTNLIILLCLIVVTILIIYKIHSDQLSKMDKETCGFKAIKSLICDLTKGTIGVKLQTIVNNLNDSGVLSDYNEIIKPKLEQFVDIGVILSEKLHDPEIRTLITKDMNYGANELNDFLMKKPTQIQQQQYVQMQQTAQQPQEQVQYNTVVVPQSQSRKASKPCMFHTSKKTCKKNIDCKWNNSQNSCVKKKVKNITILANQAQQQVAQQVQVQQAQSQQQGNDVPIVQSGCLEPIFSNGVGIENATRDEYLSYLQSVGIDTEKNYTVEEVMTIPRCYADMIQWQPNIDGTFRVMGSNAFPK